MAAYGSDHGARNGTGMRLQVVFYGEHTVAVDRLISSARPEYLIGNTPHGLWGEVQGVSSWPRLMDAEKFKRAGLKVIGYITSGYEGSGTRSLDSRWCGLDMNVKLIAGMARLDGVDGIFVDECSSYPGVSSKDYLRQISNIAHGHGLIVWGNVGVDSFDPWYFEQGGFDYIQSTERWRGQPLSPVQREWGHRISVTGCQKEYLAADAFALTVDAWNKGLAYCYMNSVDYDSLAPWFAEYAAMIARRPEQSSST